MKIELTSQQKSDQLTFRTFAREEIAPYAQQYDDEQRTPSEVITKFAQQGYLGAIIPAEYNGTPMDMITFGLLNEELGRVCSSTRSLITVHSMVAYALLRWGNQEQKQHWLPKLATGECIAAFALSEPNVGSDAKSVETVATLTEGGYILQGHKKWITFGQVANVFLIFAHCNGKVSAFLVERDFPGFTTSPITGLLGMRAAMLAELYLDEVFVPKENLVGGIGFGLASVATASLDIGRYTVAWGGVGLAQGCLDASLQYTSQRKQFGVLLKEHQLIQQMISNMIVHTQAARLLCYQAGYSKDMGNPETVMETWMAKYFVSEIAIQIASDAVQIHGANGCTTAYVIQRFFRDAKIMEIIEGSTQMQQVLISRSGYQSMRAAAHAQRTEMSQKG